ncbi:effector-associated domain 2-containing protein [Kutzneria buriramensis]|uniref:VMAP-C domain-containing protein n=1 Tax=Kutzneria buriramensis TaxID=1045776 RepID=UPI0011C1BE73|nr:hypothetical protein [Kutzneria buriramensis]
MRLRLQEDFVLWLEDCPTLQSENARLALVERLAVCFGAPLPLRAMPTVRAGFIELVTVCGRQPDGLAALVKQVRFLDPLAADGQRMAELADEWQAFSLIFGTGSVDLTADRSWAELRAVLLPVRLSGTTPGEEGRAVSGLARVATDYRLAGLPPHCSTVWSAFTHLVGANAAPKSLPPWMVFLDCVAERLAADLARARAVQRWVRQYAREWGLEQRLDDAPWRARHKADEVRWPAYLVIQVNPDPRGSDRIVLSHWWQHDQPEWRPRRQRDRHITRADLRSEFDDVVTEVEAALGTMAEVRPTTRLMLEFVLPLEMLNEPVEFWLQRSPVGGEPRPFVLDHSIVLRSLERLREPSLHLAWRRRWEAFKRQPRAVRAYWSQPSGVNYFGRLAADLSSDQTIVSLVLSEPLTPGNAKAREEWATALRCGVPAILWHREDCGDSDFRAAVAAIAADGGLARLPERISELRQAALRVGPDELAARLGRNLAVLWDDPERLPESPRAVGVSGEGTA